MSEAQVDNERLYLEALHRVCSELGVPGEGYPANVANAYYIGSAAIHGHRFAFGDEKYDEPIVFVVEALSESKDN